ncbi:Uncharacterized protein APZ42_023101 [Daphnia magna]|uniref:Reverse transcriptase domain-containing protein n=1 Tax=Daphnia magna TaxID=35525 RepID=A0A162DHZ1_9CRUS|nr:Uncharacterized protein APZ42_023101 [Daphnia magna]
MFNRVSNPDNSPPNKRPYVGRPRAFNDLGVPTLPSSPPPATTPIIIKYTDGLPNLKLMKIAERDSFLLAMKDLIGVVKDSEVMHGGDLCVFPSALEQQATLLKTTVITGRNISCSFVPRRCSKPSTIDLIITSSVFALNANISIGPYTGSDHLPISTTLNAEPTRLSHKPPSWIFNKPNWPHWNTELEVYLNSKSFKELTRPEQVFDTFMEAILTSADSLLDFFSATPDQPTLQSQEDAFLEPIILAQISNQQPNELYLAFTPNELELTCNKTKRNATGVDEILNKMIANLSPNNKENVLHLFNSLYIHGVVPELWKMAIVIPILKPGKLRMKIVTNNQSWFIEQKNILVPEQAGFRKNRSPIDHLVKIDHDIKTSLKEKKSTVTVFLDINKAYETVWTQGLLYKLTRIGVNGNCLGWLYNFLLNRSICIRLGGHTTDLRIIRNGVPQGATISPLLFNLMLHDFPPPPPHANLLLYADDVTIYAPVTRPIEAEIALQPYLDKDRASSTYLHRLRSGHTHLNSFSHRIDPDSDPSCRYGCTAMENAQYIVMDHSNSSQQQQPHPARRSSRMPPSLRLTVYDKKFSIGKYTAQKPLHLEVPTRPTTRLWKKSFCSVLHLPAASVLRFYQQVFKQPTSEHHPEENNAAVETEGQEIINKHEGEETRLTQKLNTAENQIKQVSEIAEQLQKGIKVLTDRLDKATTEKINLKKNLLDFTSKNKNLEKGLQELQNRVRGQESDLLTVITAENQVEKEVSVETETTAPIAEITILQDEEIIILQDAGQSDFHLTNVPHIGKNTPTGKATSTDQTLRTTDIKHRTYCKRMLVRYGTYQPPRSPINTIKPIRNYQLTYNLGSDVEVEIPKLIRIPVKILNKEIIALVDTGVTASLVSSNILDTLECNENLKQLENTNPPIFRTVSGQELKSIGKFEFSVIINDNYIINHHFNVMNNLNEQCILGLDFLSNNNVKINTRNRQICYDHFGVEHNFRKDEDLTQQDYRNLESFTQLDFNNKTKQIARIAEKVEQALNVSDDIRTKIEILLKKHEGLFADQESDLGLATQVKHHINIGHNASINERLRKTPESLKFVVKTKIDVMLNDIIVFSNSITDHVKHLEAVFLLLKQAGMKLKRKNCEFFKEEII